MCTSSCGGLFTPGVQLDKVTCPCGRGYWDVWKAAFVNGDEVRARQAPPKEEYVARVKEELSEEEYEARIRNQYIRHFLECGVKRDLDDQVTRAGKNDGSSLRRAITEWWEFVRGDFKSKGTSQHFDANRLKDIWSRLRGSLVTNDDIRPLLPRQTSTSVKKGLDSRHEALAPRTTPSQIANARPISTPGLSVPPPVATSAEGFPRSYFISAKAGIRQDVLASHCEKAMFGRGATLQSHTQPDGTQGYLIKGTIAPTADIVQELREDSEKAATRERLIPRPVEQSSTDNRQDRDQKPPRHKDRSARDSSPKKSSDVCTQGMDAMSIPIRDRHHTQDAETTGSLPPVSLSNPPPHRDLPQANESRLSRRSRGSKDEQDSHQVADREPRTERPEHSRSRQPSSVHWQCHRCNEGPYTWPEIDKCTSCQHSRCAKCSEKRDALNPAVPATSNQDTSRPTADSRSDSRTQRPKDDTRHSSYSSRHPDKRKDVQERRQRF